MIELCVPDAAVIGKVVWLALSRILLTADTGGETTSVRLAERDWLSNIVMVAVPACDDVKTLEAVPLATATLWLDVPFANIPRVVVKVTVDAPGADTVIVWAIFVTTTALFAGEVTAITADATPLVYGWDLASPSAVALMLALPAPNPETATVATPELLVMPVGAFKPRTIASVAAKETVTPGIGTPNTSLTVALSAALELPTISADTPELLKEMLAPTTFIWLIAGLAVQPAQEAVSVELRFV